MAGKLQRAMKLIADNGMIWVSWPKKASGVLTGMTEGCKVCAVEEAWSGLKLVIRKSNRK